MNVLKTFFIASVAMIVAPTISADDYYDDDIYYDASKAKQKSVKVTPKENYSTAISSGTTTTYYESSRDVDEYNRRGGSYTVDTVGYDSVLTQDGYVYTNRIERFYNPEVVSGSGNQE